MDINIIHTGSDGNCTYISDGSTEILIDCGIKLEKVNREIGYRLSKIKAVLITHEHTDHTKYIKDIAVLAKPIYMAEQTKQNIETQRMKSPFFIPLQDKENKKIGTLLIKTIPLIHYNVNGTPCKNFGYIIFSILTNEKILWCTDTEYIPFFVPKCNYICIECNYDNDITFNKEFDIASVDKRRFISHQSLQTVKNWIQKQDLSVCSAIYLIHISNDKSNKPKMKKEIEQLTALPVFL